MTVFSPGRSGRVLDAALVYFASAWLDGLEDSEIEGTCSAIDATDGCSSKCLPSSIYLDSCKLQPIYIYRIYHEDIISKQIFVLLPKMLSHGQHGCKSFNLYMCVYIYMIIYVICVCSWLKLLLILPVQLPFQRNPNLACSEFTLGDLQSGTGPGWIGMVSIVFFKQGGSFYPPYN